MAVVECTGLCCLGVLLIPRDRLILVIKGTWVSSPNPYKKSRTRTQSHKSQSTSAIHRSRESSKSETHHSTKLLLRVLPPTPGSVRVRKRGFVPSSDTIRVAPPQRVPEPGSPPGGGGCVFTIIVAVIVTVVIAVIITVIIATR